MEKVTAGALERRAGLSRELLGIDVPPAAESAGHYAGFKSFGGIVSIVQGPLIGDAMPFRGKIGRDINYEKACEAARLCAANVLVQLERACEGDLGRVACCYRLGGFLNTGEGFDRHSQIMNVVSDTVLRVLGPEMTHSRYVVGCNTLPYDLVMELEGWFAIRN